MKAKAAAVKIHTLEQILEQYGAISHHKGLYVESWQETDQDPSLLYPFRADHYTFLLSTGGEFVLKVDLKEYRIKKNNAILLAPEVVRESISATLNCKGAVVAFSTAYLAENMSATDMDTFMFIASQMDPLLTLSTDDMRRIMDMIQLMEAKMDAPASHSLQPEVLRHLFYAFLYEMGSLYDSQQTHEVIKNTRKEELTFRFIKTLQKHYKTERSVQAYATQLNVTPKYLSQTVKEITGKTAGEFIDEVVMMEAKILLHNSTLTIGQIASYLHFNDPFIFSKYFKKQSGKSPRSYRTSTL